jgi:hypothetical protein
MNEPSLRIVEVDGAGRVIAADVPFQFELSPAEGHGRPRSGRVVLLMQGVTQKETSRKYHVYFGAGKPSQPAAVKPRLEVVDGVAHEGQESYKIVTHNAIYYYHKAGAGFASLIDMDGNDWLSFHPWGGSDGKYRGIPNLVHPEGYFHPGGARCTSHLVHSGSLKATIASQSLDGRWACMWEIYPDSARLTVLTADKPYWFLYEGTPGGKLDLDADYCIRAPGKPTPASEKWDEVLPQPEWVMFGDGKRKRVLYLVHHDADDKIDSYWPMQKNMTVFGFGRKDLKKYMTKVPAHFTIGLADEGETPLPLDAMNSAFRDLEVIVGKPERRRPSR